MVGLSKGETVERVKGCKYLGISVVDNLYWKHRINAVVMKVHSRLYCLKTVGSFDGRE